MSKSQSIETMPKEGEFLAKNEFEEWVQVVRVNKIHLYPEDAVISHRLNKVFLPVAWAELPDSETEAKRQAVIDATAEWYEEAEKANKTPELADLIKLQNCKAKAIEAIKKLKGEA